MARAEDSQQLLRAPQHHQPIIGVRGAVSAVRKWPLPALPVPEDQTAGSSLPYGLSMPARNLPTPQDAAAARRVLLDGLARG